MPDPDLTHAYAAVLAASNAVATNRAYRRGSFPDGLSPRLRVPGLADIPRLIRPTLGDPGHREKKLARTTAASLLYALDKKPGNVRTLLSPAEQEALDQLEEKRKNEATRRTKQQKDTSCHYCRFRSRALYGQGVPEVVVVNHAAQVIATFDADTNTAEAGIVNHQVLVRKAVALQMVNAFHPLLWSSNAPGLFKQSDEVFAPERGRPWTRPPPTNDQQRKDQIDAWKEEQNHFLFEDVSSPWNETMNTEFQNVLRITNFKDVALAGEGQKISFKFSLESCLASNLGLGMEYGGLDVDGGTHCGKAQPWHLVEAQRGGLQAKGGGKERTSEKDPMAHLTARDLAHLGDAVPCHGRESTLKSAMADDFSTPARTEAIWNALSPTVDFLKSPEGWDEEPWLVTISTSKRLRYAAPGNTPLGLWATLTWIAPAQLFVFINRAVCQPGDLAAMGGAAAETIPPRPTLPRPTSNVVAKPGVREVPSIEPLRVPRIAGGSRSGQ
jgi:hypothetical protein